MISNDKVSKDITRVQFYITYLAGQEIETITITDIIKRIKFAKNMKISHNMKPKNVTDNYKNRPNLSKI